jgi:hypothetical protein
MLTDPGRTTVIRQQLWNGCERLFDQVIHSFAPKAKVLDNRLYVEDGECYSSAGITAGVDLMLHLVGRLTDESCAAAIARYLVVYFWRTGADPQLSPWLERRNHVHPVVHRVQDAITRNRKNLELKWAFANRGREQSSSFAIVPRTRRYEHYGLQEPTSRHSGA